MSEPAAPAPTNAPAPDPAAAPSAPDPAAPPAPPAQPVAPTPPDGWTPPTFAEYEAQQKAVAAANKRAKALEDAAAQAQAAKQAEAGQFKELYEDQQKKAEQLEGGIKTAAVRSEVIAAASRLGFRNPQLASTLMSLDGLDATLADDYTATVDAASKSAIEDRLNALLTSDPYLKGDAPPPPPQLPGAGEQPPAQGGGTSGFNAQIRGAIRG